MFNSVRHTTSIVAFALSTVVTLGMLGVIQELATQPAADAMMAKQGQTHIATSAKQQLPKS